MASIKKRPDGMYRARFKGPDGKERSKHFKRKTDADKWIEAQVTASNTGMWVTPASAKMTMEQWSERWLEGYGTRRPGTVRAARWHISVINKTFGNRQIGLIRPSEIKAFTAALSKTYSKGSTYAIYRRLVQLLGDAVEDGIIPRSPCGRKTSPPQPTQKPHWCDDKQVWALYDAFPEHLRPAILLGAFAGLRVGEAAGLKVAVINFLGRVITPSVQGEGQELKTTSSGAPIPVPADLTDLLSAYIKAYKGTTVVTDEDGRPTHAWTIERAVRECRDKVPGLAEMGFTFHDLRHFYASTLIAAGCSIKVVQARMRHAHAKTTLETYAHLFNSTEDESRTAVANVMRGRHEVIDAEAADET